MAKKYEITWVTTMVKDHICAQWPTTFNEYVGMYALQKENTDEVVVPEPASAIRMGIDFDIPSILPAAFLRLAAIEPSSDWDKKRHVGAVISDMECSARWSLLHASDLLRLMRGKERLSRKFKNVKPHLDCSGAAELRCVNMDPTECSKQKKAFNRSATPLSSGDNSFDWIPAVFMRWQYTKIEALSLCESCQADNIYNLLEWGAKIWDSLPEEFELS